MSNTKAIVTILIGEGFINSYKKYCEKNWKLYADKHGYDIVIFTEPLDTSERAKKRSPSWQRCLIFQNPVLKKYERVVWIDSDILINHFAAPCIFSAVPEEKIGGIDGYCFYTKEVYTDIYKRYTQVWERSGSPAIVNDSAAKYYANWGLPGDVNAVIECGVLVLNASCHKDLLETVYYTYEDKGGPEWNYEMRPLSYEIIKADMHHFIDTRFNYLYSNFLMLNYPYLFSRSWKNKVHKKLFSIFGNSLKKQLSSIDTLAANTAYMNSFFLHFAGTPATIKLVDPVIVQNNYYNTIPHGIVKI
jgi:hypothetical protein